MAFFPCSATFSILQKEGGWKILRNHLAISTTSMYLLSVIVYWTAFGITG
jgi:Fe2+ transport system protein B